MGEVRDQAYWNENCEGDGVGCLGCRHWGGDGLCFFDKSYRDPDFDDTGLDGCKSGESIRKVDTLAQENP